MSKPQMVTVGGLVSARPLSALLQEETAQAQAQDAAQRAAQAANAPVISSLVDQIKKHWSLAKEAKLPIEREMLRAVRAKRGEYDPEKLAVIREQGSDIYMRVFATKARQMKALMTDVLIAAGSEKPWSLAPTPLADLPPETVDEIMQVAYQQTLQAEQSGLPLSVEDVRQMLADSKAGAEKRIREEAQKEAERAEKAVEDVLVEGGWLEALDGFIDDLSTFKTAIMKGPVVRMMPRMTWGTGPAGAVPITTLEPKLMFERVDPFMVYPVPWARNAHDAPLIERHKLSRSALSALIGVEGYSEDAIRAVLDAHGTGGLGEWLQVDSDRAAAEGQGNVTLNQRSDLIDALQYWGSVSGKMLREWGMTAEEVQDEAKEYEVEAWLIGSWVIKAVINPDPMFRRPYYTDGFSRVPGSFWHNSMFDAISDTCDICNAAGRALSNNMGISSGPQVVINVDRLPHGEEVTNLYPWKLHQVTSDPMGSSAAPISFFQPQSNAAELMNIFERFSNLADEYSGIPRYMAGMGGGEGGAGRTASGMSMMISNAGKMTKQTLASLDLNVIAPSVERTFQWLMQYKPELNLRGDLQVQARGATSMMAKEAAQVRLNEFIAATGNPIDMQIVGMDGRAELLRHAAKRLDINPDKVVPSASALKLREMAAQQQQQAAQMMAMQGQSAKQAGSGQELMDQSPVVDNFSPTAQGA